MTIETGDTQRVIEAAAVEHVLAWGTMIGVTVDGAAMSLGTRHTLTCPGCGHETALVMLAQSIGPLGPVAYRVRCVECYTPTTRVPLVDSVGVEL